MLAPSKTTAATHANKPSQCWPPASHCDNTRQQQRPEHFHGCGLALLGVALRDLEVDNAAAYSQLPEGTMQRTIGVVLLFVIGSLGCGDDSGPSFESMCNDVTTTICSRCWKDFGYASQDSCDSKVEPQYCGGGAEGYCSGTDKAYDPSMASACLNEAKTLACSKMYGGAPPACYPSVVCK
jgi:hypothetical protein